MMNPKFSINTTKENLESIYKTAKQGISKEDKKFLLNELDTMIQSLEDWKEKNQNITQGKKIS